MAIKFGPIERVFVCEQGALTPNPPGSVTLPPNGSVELCAITVQGACPAILLSAVVNWSATFSALATPVIIDTPGFAQVTFQILLNGVPIYRVIESAAQQGVSVVNLFSTASTSYVTTSLLHFDLSNLLGISTTNVDTYSLRATNIILQPPLDLLGAPAGTVTAAASPITFVAEAIRVHRDGE